MINILRLLLLFLTMSCAFAAPPPVADYRFNELLLTGAASEILDSSSNAFHGNILLGSGHTLPLSEPAGKNCTAYINTTGGYMNVADNPTLRLGTSYTISAWIKTNASAVYLVKKYQDSAPYPGFAFTIDVNYGSGKLSLWTGTGAWVTSNGAAVNDGQWHFVAVVVNGKQVQFYVDGVTNGSALTLSNNTTSSTVPLKIAYVQSGNSIIMDDLLIFNTNLSAAEIASVYNNQLAGKDWSGTVSTGCTPNPLVADYRFNEQKALIGTANEVVDSSGNALHGTNTVPAVQQLEPPGKNCTAVMNTVNNYITVADRQSLRFTSDYTISAWVRTTAGSAFIVKKYVDFAPYLGYSLAIDPNYGSGKLALWTGTGAWANSNGAAVNDGEWHFVAVVVKYNKVQFYVDGVPNGTQLTIAGSTTTSNAPMRMAYPTSSNSRMMMDDALIWGRDLSSSEISAIYNNQLAGKDWTGTVSTSCSFSQLPLVDYRFNELTLTGAANEVADSSGNALHGTLTLGSLYLLPLITPPGKNCTAMLNSTNGYTTAPEQIKLRFASEFSMSAWIRTSAGSAHIIKKYLDYSPYPGYAFSLDPAYSSGKLAFWNGNGAWYISNGTAVNDNQWHFVAMTVRGNKLQFYVDGIPNGSPITIANMTISTANIVMAYPMTSASIMMMDDALMFDRELSSAEINTIYTNQLNGKDWTGTTSTACSFSTAPLADYRFNEQNLTGAANEIIDSSGSGFHGTRVSPSIVSLFEFKGKNCTAASVASNNYIAIPDNTQLHFNSEFSISAWVRTTATTALIVQKYHDYSPYTGYAFAIDPAYGSGKLAFWNGNGAWIISNGAAVNDGQWHFVAMVVRGTKLQFYVDGALNGSQLNIANTPSSTAQLRIAYPLSNNTGMFDDILIFGRDLSSAEIATIYNNQLAGKDWTGTVSTSCTVNSLVAHYHFNEGTLTGAANEVVDSSGNNLHGTITGAVTEAAGKNCTATNSTVANTYINVSDNAKFRFNIYYTITAWIKTTATSAHLVKKYIDSSPYAGHALSIDPAYGSGKLAFWNTSGAWVVSNGAAVNDGQWHFIAAVITSNRIQFYVDGAPNGSAIAIGAPTLSNAPLRLSYPYSTTSLMMDDVLIFNRDLSVGELASIYQNQANGFNWDGTADPTCPSTRIAEYHFEEGGWTGSTGELRDTGGYAGGPFNGTGIGSPKPIADTTSPARAGSVGTCGYASFSGPYQGGGAFDVNGLPVSTTAGAKTSVSFWVRWNGTNSVMPIGWQRHDLVFSTGSDGVQYFGFNGSADDLYGIPVTPFTDNGWHHVVAVFNNGDYTQNKLYIDGTSYTSSLAVRRVSNQGINYVSSDFRIGGWRNIDSTWDARYRYIGDLDEVKIFKKELLLSEVKALHAETHSCVSPIDHMRINHTGTGVTCSASQVTLQVCAGADQVGGTCIPDTRGVSGTLLAKNSSTQTLITSIPFSIPAGSSSVIISLPITAAQTISLSITGLSAATSSSDTCWVGSTASCNHQFNDAGFFFDVSNHVAENAKTFTIGAVKKSDNTSSCTPAFADVTSSVNFKCSYLNPNTGSKAVRLFHAGNSQYVPLESSLFSDSCDSSGANIPLSFNSTGVASTTLLYEDVGKIKLDASYTGSGIYSGLVMNGTDEFIAAPKDFVVTLDTATPIKAGANFSISVQARNQLNNPTPNFNKESSHETVAISATRLEPVGTYAQDGSFTNSTLTGFSNGLATTGDVLQWSEVGKIQVTAALSSHSYLGSGIDASGMVDVGTFIPHHFDTSITPACATGGFTYSAQPIPLLTITAKNAQNGKTSNYDGTGGMLPIQGKDVTLSEANGIAGSFTATNIAASSFNQGEAQVSPTYTFTNRQTPPSAIKLRVSNSDGISSATGSETTANIYSGRARLFNANGATTLALPTNLKLEHWDGSRWIVNSADTCSAISNNNLAFNFPNGTTITPNNLTACDSAATISGSSPNYTVNLSAPGVNNYGWTDMTLNLSNVALGAGNNRCISVGGAGGAETPANMPWLQFTWEGGTTSVNPKARMTFGAGKASKVIYMREVH